MMLAYKTIKHNDSYIAVAYDIDKPHSMFGALRNKSGNYKLFKKNETALKSAKSHCKKLAIKFKCKTQEELNLW